MPALPEIKLAPEFDPDIYRALHSDLVDLNSDDLHAHYLKFGRHEGRVANHLKSRVDFVQQIPDSSRVLEIGPFANPMLVRPSVRYCDMQDQSQLRERARALGLDPRGVPPIHHLLGAAGLDSIPDQFDTVTSSHSIEHQPDLVAHLQQVERRLHDRSGRYFALIPDKRYCFDRLISPSTIADVLDAYENQRRSHTLRSVVEHRSLTTHNNADLHWRQPEPQLQIKAAAVRAAIDEWRAARGGYVDVHAWYFTPDSFCNIIRLLEELGLTSFVLERIYPTRRGSEEFWAVLSLHIPTENGGES